MKYAAQPARKGPNRAQPTRASRPPTARSGPDQILDLQRSVGNAGVQRLLREATVQRSELAGLATLDELLDRFDVPEQQVITTLAALSPAEKDLVAAMVGYRDKLAAAMNTIEMGQCLQAIGAGLATALDWLLTVGATYAAIRPWLIGATPAERSAVLDDSALLRTLADELRFADFAKTMEWLGRRAPDRAALLADSRVQQELEAAWVRSNPGVRVVPVDPERVIHEEGGAVYLNLITNELSFRTWEGGPFDTSERLPAQVEDSVIVATFHTHPQLGPEFVRTPSPGDLATGASNGVPGIIRTEANGAPAWYAYGPDVRLHLAGSNVLRAWSYPGPDGGLPP